jgi:hypothetical protein
MNWEIMGKGIKKALTDYGNVKAQEAKLSTALLANELDKKQNLIFKMQEQDMERQNKLKFIKEMQAQFKQQNGMDGMGGEGIDTPQVQVGATGEPTLKYPSARDKEFTIKLGLNRIAQKEGKGMKLTPQEQSFKETYGGMGTDNKGLNRASGLRKEFQDSPIYKNYQIVNSQFNSLKSAYALSLNPDNESRAASDQALIVTLNKMLDPTSVVRESEFARTEVGVGLMNRIQSYLPKIKKGGQAISNTDRKAVYDMASKLLQGSQEGLNKHIDRYVNIAKQYGVDPGLILGDIKKFDTSSSQFNTQADNGLNLKIEQARKAGYSEEEIQSYLKSKGIQ